MFITFEQLNKQFKLFKKKENNSPAICCESILKNRGEATYVQYVREDVWNVHHLKCTILYSA